MKKPMYRTHEEDLAAHLSKVKRLALLSLLVVILVSQLVSDYYAYHHTPTHQICDVSSGQCWPLDFKEISK